LDFFLKPDPLEAFMTTKEARQRLQEIVSHVANIDFHKIHQCAHNQINMETVRRIAKLNSKKADAFISLLGELTSQRDSMRALFAVADPAVLVTFTYRYIVIIRYLTTAPLDSSLYLSAITIYMRYKSQQPAVICPIPCLSCKMRGQWSDLIRQGYYVRMSVSQPSSHSQRSICAGRTTGKPKRSRQQIDGIGNGKDDLIHCESVYRSVPNERSRD